MNFPPASAIVDPRLQHQLHAVAARGRAQGLHRRSTVAWLALAVASIAWIALSWRIAALRPASFPVLGLAMLVVGWIVSRWWRQAPYDFPAAAALIEKDHPDLQQVLRTALEQRPAQDGSYHFLQRRVIDRALAHAGAHPWADSRRHLPVWPGITHALALIAVVVLLGFSIRPPAPLLTALMPENRPTGTITVTPGDTEVERGSTVVVAARFDGDLPRAATLVWTPAGGLPQRAAMSRSLSDPVYALTLPRVEQDVDYHVEYDAAGSDAFHLSVYDLPSLVRADAALDYPEYTGLADRRIEDTRRLSAVEGTKVDYDFMFNKPVKQATLRTADGEEVPLTPANPERTRYALAFTVEHSVRYTLHLEDDAARANVAPPDIRIEALVNRRPELKIAFPRGDQRVSALEEMKLQGEARDDFGLLDYGIAIAVGAQEPEYFSLHQADEKTLTAKFEQLLTLENHGVQPDELVTWFAWADDAGADGAPRRSASDPFFGEVRPFDEIFREQPDAPSGGQQPGGGGEGAELLELQRQIAIGIWKQRQQNPAAASFAEDVGVLTESQAQAQEMLSHAAEELQDPTKLQAAVDAGGFMEKAHDGLTAAAKGKSVEPLAGAWTAAQGAYRALLRLQDHETNVSQSKNGRSGASRNQRQLDQLKFRNNEDNYESESEAQAMTSPEERAKLETLARLKDLARRQQDVNERLQKLQTALQEARDEAERDRVQRELKRLEEEQRRMLSDLDDARQRLDGQPPSDSTQEASEQLEKTREAMRQAGDSLQQGNVSQALAQGTKAEEKLQEASDNLRKESSSRFAEQLREARRSARELAENQQRTEKEISEFDSQGPRPLDSSAERAEIADRVEQQQVQHETLVESLRQITEDSEVSEPGLHRQLYDLLREHGQSGVDNRMETGSELLRRGLMDQARDLQPGVTRDLDQLRRGVERAADSVLGDETNTLRFAKNELDELSRQLDRERGANGQNPSPDQKGANGQQPGEQPNGQGREPGQNGAGERPDENGTGGSRVAGQDPNGQQPGAGERGRDPNAQPGTGEESPTGERGARPDETGTQTAGTGEPRPGQQPGASGQQPGEQPGETGQGQQGEGRQPGEGRSPSGEQPGSAPGGQQGGREVAQNGQPGEQPGEGEGTQPGQRRGQRPGQQGQGQSPGPGEGQPGGEGSPSGVAQSGTQPGPRGGRGGSPGGDPSADELERALNSLGGGPGGVADGEMGPITGEDFTGWEERLRTVESLLDSPEARARLAAARETAQQMRGEFRRHSKPPQWGDVESGISAPLSEVRTWLRQELARREDPTSLQPVDRDPVPERFEENVRKYYEALGE